ncbi:hypothetical protein EJ05DRAFT_481194 [Pseudovirgaria hyperparasitica]|uniref:Uncharacterized protein n=1 Tax=Pseudovirgaria hyperparasitica TaxID=470096 RepID=A0A6A6VPJ3_9PEZI|nr:uncharacterized protein EJ05DRAFT_481294 [Pseudovirgaria hyperparasitica]XP_033595006.1 uncharacterized protein EJ05DRAFT_481194 [Pseudovirgaria hyperparasitica]KAF2752439.1 hypothetical protein EJ05DRAFT_481294 [Pseudovirgaria hyperparasitica]KAF2752548.1 hypothetical protein EJ05DRAFT_481194 [Pseudovirgaria hyperparasitica]
MTYLESECQVGRQEDSLLIPYTTISSASAASSHTSRQSASLSRVKTTAWFQACSGAGRS